jgi:hypothetical protein
VFLRTDGIVQIHSTDHTYKVEDIKAIHKAVSKLTNNQKALLLLLANNFTSVDADARKFLSSPEAGAHSIAEAYVIKSLAQRIILNFLIKVNGTPVPVKFFTDSEAAIEWLQSFNKNSITEIVNDKEEHLSKKD